eukprot:6044365-Prymnesium_polylepis.1
MTADALADEAYARTHACPLVRRMRTERRGRNLAGRTEHRTEHRTACMQSFRLAHSGRDIGRWNEMARNILLRMGHGHCVSRGGAAWRKRAEACTAESVACCVMTIGAVGGCTDARDTDGRV